MMPSRDRNTGEGVLTRAQRMTVATGLIGVTRIPVAQQCLASYVLCLRCLSTSYFNLAYHELSDVRKVKVRELELSETNLADKLSENDFPLRLTQSRWFTGAPRQPCIHVRGSYRWPARSP